MCFLVHLGQGAGEQQDELRQDHGPLAHQQVQRDPGLRGDRSQRRGVPQHQGQECSLFYFV